MAHGRDLTSLTPAVRRFHDALARVIPGDRLHADPLRTFAFGTDASFYRLVPKLVVQARDEDEVRAVLAASRRERVPVTFRAAGTSLSGQAVTDHVLVVLAGGWRAAAVHGSGESITLGPGVIGAEANALLAPHGRKIGPDPASIGACMIGGIAANNASGMCCGTAQNSYRTVESMRIVLADGTLLDTGDPESRRRLAAARPELVDELAAIRDAIAADPVLAERIRSKYRIKNTTGYSLNAFVDFHDPIDILLHLMIGSEGTLGFISELTYRTVPELPHKASALVAFPDVESAALATMCLRDAAVSSAELMDRASLRAVEHRPGLPSWLATLGPDACALLVEVRAGDARTLAAGVADVTARLREVRTLLPVAFTDRREEYERLWDVRRGLFPAVGAARRIGTTVVIEDVAFQLEDLAPATVELQRLMRRHGYDEGILFGHALDGNLHFVFTQDFAAPAEVERYARFMDDVCFMVTQKYEGSLKGEHGTGRNVAPFVELEWGAKAYELMRRVKRVLDPDGLLNPGVLLNDDPRAHLRDLKPLPAAHELVDRCTECGFCEPRCPSRNLSLSPRQRIAVRREIARLAATGADSDPPRPTGGGLPLPRRGDLRDRRALRDGVPGRDRHGRAHEAAPRRRDAARATSRRARKVAASYGAATAAVRAGLRGADLARAVVGAPALAAVSRGLRVLSGGRLPVWNASAPRPAPRAAFEDVASDRERKVVYFPSCVVRAMGPAAGDPDERALFEATLSLLDKADYGVLFPAGLEGLCCGLTFDSKGFPELADEKARELERELLARSEDGALPILCDTSPCLARMRKTLDPRLRLYEPAELIHDFLLERLTVVRREGTVALHVPCSATKLGLAPKLRAVAEACAERVVVPAGVGCCGFAGDRGFTHPELNASALGGLRAALPAGLRARVLDEPHLRDRPLAARRHPVPVAGLPGRSVHRAPGARRRARAAAGRGREGLAGARPPAGRSRPAAGRAAARTGHPDGSRDPAARMVQRSRQGGAPARADGIRRTGPDRGRNADEETEAMTWTQIYTPLGNLYLSALVAAIPVVVLLGALAFFHVKAHIAALIGLVARPRHRGGRLRDAALDGRRVGGVRRRVRAPAHRLDHPERDLHLRHHGEDREVRGGEGHHRRARRRSPHPGAAHRVRVRRVHRGRGGLRHAGRDQRRDAHRPRLQAARRRRPRAHRQHRAGRVRRARHAHHHAREGHRPERARALRDGRPPAPVLLAHRPVLARVGDGRVPRHARRLAGLPRGGPLVRRAAVPRLELHRAEPRRHHRRRVLHRLHLPVPQGLAAEGGVALPRGARGRRRRRRAGRPAAAQVGRRRRRVPQALLRRGVHGLDAVDRPLRLRLHLGPAGREDLDERDLQPDLRGAVPPQPRAEGAARRREARARRRRSSA